MSNTAGQIRIVIGPNNETGPGTAWCVWEEYENDKWEVSVTGGSRGMPRNPEDPDAWLRYAKRVVRLRGQIPWSRATVRPSSPQGIVITFD